jgi:hypothetical protein
MSSKQLLIVVALVAVCLWSAVMAALGELTAVAALIPSLGLLVQQIAAALNGAGPSTTPGQAGGPASAGEPAADEGSLR